MVWPVRAAASGRPDRAYSYARAVRALTRVARSAGQAHAARETPIATASQTSTAFHCGMMVTGVRPKAAPRTAPMGTLSGSARSQLAAATARPSTCTMA